MTPRLTRPLQARTAPMAQPMLRLIVVALAAVHLAISAIADEIHVHNASVSIAEKLAIPARAVLPDPFFPTLSGNDFAGSMSYRKTQISPPPVLSIDGLLFEASFWPAYGFRDSPRMSHSTWILGPVLFASLGLFLIPPIEPLGTKRSLRTIALTLLITLPIPVVFYLVPKFWHELATTIPSAAVASIATTRLGIWLSWSGLLVLYPIAYLALRRPPADRGRSDDRCVACDYELGSLPTCPECGTARGPTPRTRRLRPRPMHLLAVGCPLLLFLAPIWLSWATRWL